MNKILLLSFLLLCPVILLAQSDNAIMFDNVDDHITAPGASALVSNSTALSLTMWVYPQNTLPTYPDYDGFAGFRNNTNADFYILQLTANGIEARFRNSSGVAYDITYNSLQLNTWQNFALTYDGSTLNLYHNGILAGSVVASGTITTTGDPFYMGMTPWTGADFYLNGRLDEVSLWNSALSLPEINCIYTGAIDPSELNLMLYYKFNQGIAGGNNTGISNLVDSKGNINGTFNGLALNGSASNFVSGVTTPNATNISDVLCPGATYTFGSQTITMPGTYFESFPIPGGCDSIVTLVLTAPVINISVGQSGPVLISQQTGAAYQWIDCLNGNAPIPGAVSQSFTATANGQYAVIVTLGGCSDTSICLTVTGVGINEVIDTFFEIGPNPFTNQLVIKNNHTTSFFMISIYDISGKLIKKVRVENDSAVLIQTSGWKAGMYLITDDSGTINMKIIKD